VSTFLSEGKPLGETRGGGLLGQEGAGKQEEWGRMSSVGQDLAIVRVTQCYMGEDGLLIAVLLRIEIGTQRRRADHHTGRCGGRVNTVASIFR